MFYCLGEISIAPGGNAHILYGFPGRCEDGSTDFRRSI